MGLTISKTFLIGDIFWPSWWQTFWDWNWSIFRVYAFLTITVALLLDKGSFSLSRSYFLSFLRDHFSLFRSDTLCLIKISLKHFLFFNYFSKLRHPLTKIKTLNPLNPSNTPNFHSHPPTPLLNYSITKYIYVYIFYKRRL